MKTITIKENGVTASIRRVAKVKNGKKYFSYVVRYNHLGERRQIWRADLEAAKGAAQDACALISTGKVLTDDVISTGDRLAYIRATEALTATQVPIDTACREYADALKIMDGKASIIEACRDWVKRHTVILEKITLADAVEQLKRQTITDGKSKVRQKALAAALDRLAEAFSVQVHTVTPDQISRYLAALPFVERTKRNHRDTIGYFNRWLILRGYLSKGTDWLEGVQNYTARKLGEIEIYTPEEMKLLLSKADERLLPFLAIGAFAGLRHAEIARLDWSEIDIADQNGESFIEIRADKSKTQTRRLVPVKNNLKAWLKLHQLPRGLICPFENITKQLLKTAASAGVKWKHNGLRHSFISYRVAESADVPRTADEAGNSVQVIRSNYLRRVKPAFAVEWFNIHPPCR